MNRGSPARLAVNPFTFALISFRLMFEQSEQRILLPNRAGSVCIEVGRGLTWALAKGKPSAGCLEAAASVASEEFSELGSWASLNRTSLKVAALEIRSGPSLGQLAVSEKRRDRDKNPCLPQIAGRFRLSQWLA
jgi:hypothetical protein